MKRREFCTLAGACGLVAAAPFGLERRLWARLTARPQEFSLYEGNLLLVVTGPGGWDQTMFCDPHADLCNYYDEGDIETAGDIRFAPTDPNRSFFPVHGDRTVVFNGVDMLTNNHGVGPRANASGTIADGYPNIAALLAASHGADLPLPFLTHGVLNYNGTAGLVSRTKARAGAHLTLLMDPHERNPGSTTDNSTYYDTETIELVRAAKQARLEALTADQRLLRGQRSLDALYLANASTQALSRLRDFLPPFQEDERRRTVQFIMAAFAAGLSAGASMIGSPNAFDSHASNDMFQLSTFAEMLSVINYAWEEAERQSIADRLTVLAVSDFGRTPNYNDRDNGKDHWQVGSMIAMGNSLNGGRVVGATDDGLQARSIDVASLEPSDDGVVLEPRHVHQALRTHLGVAAPLDAAFPLRANPMPEGLLD